MRLRPLVAIPVLLTLPLPALANMAKSVIDGDRPAILAPSARTAIRVDGESLDFTVDSKLHTAAVTATYRLSSAATEGTEGADVAFVYLRPDGDHDAKARVEIDGAPVEAKAQSDAEVLEPALRDWLAAHKDVDQALHAVVDKGDSIAGDPSLRDPVAAAGGRCDYDDCRALLSWYRWVQDYDEDRPVRHAEDDRIYFAAHEAIPGEVEALAKRWSATHDRPRLGFLRFHLDMVAGQRRTVTVRYEQRATRDRAKHVNETFTFDYLLSPAKQWASFGPLDVTVHAPPDLDFSSPFPLKPEGDAYRASLPTLPEGELSFSLRSRQNLWFGWADTGNYWIVLTAGMLGSAIAVGAGTGRWWQQRRRWVSALLRLFAAGPLAASVSFAVLVLLSIAFPPHALGFGYGGLVGGALLVLLSIPVGAVASFVSAAVRARRAQG